jgi:DtxR family Mn-dependent transcriptional regulator
MTPKDNKQLTRKERDFLVKIVENQHLFPLRLADIARSMQVKPPTALDVIRRLTGKGYVMSRSGMIIPTEKGKTEYHELIEAHRVMECVAYLSGELLENACDEVCRYDYLMDHDTVEKIWNMLGKPTVCPHGKLIRS